MDEEKTSEKVLFNWSRIILNIAIVLIILSCVVPFFGLVSMASNPSVFNTMWWIWLVMLGGGIGSGIAMIVCSRVLWGLSDLVYDSKMILEEVIRISDNNTRK